MPKNQLIIVTYNIQFAINEEDILNNLEKMAKEGVEIFCLQEIITVLNEEFIVNKILKKLGPEWQAAYHVGEVQRESKLSIGTCILWNKDILKLENEIKILLPKLNKFALHEKLYYKIIGVPGIPLQRRAIAAYFKFGNETIRITSIHVDNVGGPKHRMKQVAYFLMVLKTKSIPQYEIICGDFNSFDLLKTGIEKKLLQKMLGKDFVDASESVDWTDDIYNIDFSTSIPLFSWFIKTFNVHVKRKLDYIWVKNWKISDCRKLKLSGSDHMPIIAKLKL